jgi:hypothetical protein
MGIRNPNYGKLISFIKGTDDTTAVGSPDLTGTLSKAHNTDLVDDSLAKKRSGYTPQNAAWGTRRIRQGFNYTKTNGTSEILLYGEGSTITGTSGILGKQNGTGVPTTILSGLADNIKPTILQFRNLAFIFNGKDDFLYDGISTRQIGISQPASAPTFVSNISGNLNNSGSYLFAYVYVNSSTGAQSSPSLPSAIFTTTDSLAGIRIQVTAGDSVTADKIWIYRTVSGGNVFFKDGEININETIFNSTNSDGSLGNEMELDNSRLSEKVTYAVVNDNRIFVAGFKSNPSRIQYSKIGLGGSMPESFQALDFIDCNINDGDIILGLVQSGTTTIVLKQRSVGRLVRVDAIQGGLERQGSQKYLYEEISNGVTCLSGHVTAMIDNVVAWLGKNDIYATDGVTIYRLGKRIRNTLNALNFNQFYKFSGITKTDTQQIMFSVCRPGAIEPDFQFVGHYRNFQATQEVAWTYYTPGVDSTIHPGLRASCLFSGTENNTTTFYFGCSDAVGLFYKMNDGGNDNTKGIYWDIRTPWEEEQHSTIYKVFHSYYAFIIGSGNTANNTVTHTFEEDCDEDVIVRTKTTTLSTSTTLWNSSNWNQFNWSSLKFKLLTFFPKRRAFFGRYGVNNIFADQPIAIKGIGRVTQLDSV